MALPAKQSNYPDGHDGGADVAQMPQAAMLIPCDLVEQKPGMKETAQEYAHRAGEMVDETAHRASAVLAETRTRFSEIWDTTMRRASEVMDTTKHRTGELLETSKRGAYRVYGQARDRAAVGYARASAQAREWADVTQRSARMVKREYPVQTLATIAAAAFLVGVGLRVWRSQS